MLPIKNHGGKQEASVHMNLHEGKLCWSAKGRKPAEEVLYNERENVHILESHYYIITEISEEAP